MVHVSETCDPLAPHLLTHVHTTPATVHEAQCTEPIQQALIEKDLPPREHLVDAAYISSERLVRSRDEQDIILRGPARPSQGWQMRVEGAYGPDQFMVDWEQQQVRCPQGQVSATWWDHGGGQGSSRPILVEFAKQTCAPCPVRAACTRAKHTGRRLRLPPRAGIEGTLSQGVHAFGLRCTRYRSLAKTHLQHVATAAAINIDRIVAWLDERPLAPTRLSRFAALAPPEAHPPATAVG